MSLLLLKFISSDSEHKTMQLQRIVQEADMTQNPRAMAIRACLTLGRHCPMHYVPLLYPILTALVQITIPTLKSLKGAK